MIKPIYGAASIGVVRVNTLEDLEKTYIRVQKEMSGARIVAGALTQGDDEDVNVRLYSYPVLANHRKDVVGSQAPARLVSW